MVQLCTWANRVHRKKGHGDGQITSRSCNIGMTRKSEDMWNVAVLHSDAIGVKRYIGTSAEDGTSDNRIVAAWGASWWVSSTRTTIITASSLKHAQHLTRLLMIFLTPVILLFLRVVGWFYWAEPSSWFDMKSAGITGLPSNTSYFSSFHAFRISFKAMYALYIANFLNFTRFIIRLVLPKLVSKANFLHN